MNSGSIKLVGVGGQGTILAAKVLAGAFIEAGYDVKMSEIHGMSQRGGSVTTEIRFGPIVHSPVVERGSLDILVAFELMEAARYADYLKKDGLLLCNNLRLDSMLTLTGKMKYPDGIESYLNKHFDVKIFSASEMAHDLGNAKAMNNIMLGALSKYLNSTLDFMTALKNNVKPKYLELNVKAFQLGASLSSS